NQTTAAHAYCGMHHQVDLQMPSRGRDPGELESARADGGSAYPRFRDGRFPADHQGDDIVLVHAGERLRVARVLTIAQDRDAVTQIDDLVELVADEENACALVAQAAQDTHEALDLMLADRRRGDRKSTR